MSAGPHDDERPDDPPQDGPLPGEPRDAGGDDDRATSPEEVEARWQEIVSRLEDLDDLAGPQAEERRGRTGPLRPGGGTLRPRRTEDPGVGGAHPSEVAGHGDGPPPLTGPPAPTGPRAWSPDPDVEEAEDHFDPPDPGPVLGGDPLLTMAWVAVIGLPLLLLASVLVWHDVPSLVLGAAAAGFLAGLGLLLWRMPHSRDEDDGPGAVV